MLSRTSKMKVPFAALFFFYSTSRVTSSNAIDAWKMKGGLGSDETSVVKSWEAHDRELHRFLKESIPEALAHTGSTTFDEHLKGVQSVLRSWGSDLAVSDAGLFHSIYGTEGFQGYKLPFSHRKDIRKLIGTRAEQLAWIFCVVDRSTVDESLYMNEKNLSSDEFKYKFCSREELGRFPIPLPDEDTWLDFLELTLADWLEQVEGAAAKENNLFGWEVGGAWSYRRSAYKKMAQILAEKRGPRLIKAQMTCDDVYAMEPEEFKGLHQIKTPPMSVAAKEARDAIMSIYN